MKRYQILSDFHTDGLEDKVNRSLEEGWQLVGQPYFHSGKTFQAMQRGVTVYVGKK